MKLVLEILHKLNTEYCREYTNTRVQITEYFSNCTLLQYPVVVVLVLLTVEYLLTLHAPYSTVGYGGFYC